MGDGITVAAVKGQESTGGTVRDEAIEVRFVDRHLAGLEHRQPRLASLSDPNPVTKRGQPRSLNESDVAGSDYRSLHSCLLVNDTRVPVWHLGLGPIEGVCTHDDHDVKPFRDRSCFYDTKAQRLNDLLGPGQVRWSGGNDRGAKIE